ncbi:high-affinity Zn(2+) transporter zrt1 [Pichia californica]|uniref:High-affinity Zn(2+) transporter zrt1 n=1 Tax=Pichia californica TaxID=460514 RepID=A0A9P7BG64_9ASCO|nr:high-affinity Zn(2+) transporter zrt1 [[Candida] californica]KAG0689641.1 high-affinity Zn(2+) transporter zrt1 [[Candida] californica]
MPDWSVYGNVSDILLSDENVPDSFKTCVIQGIVDAGSEFSGGIGTRVGSIFVIGVISTFVTMFPILSQKYNWKVSIWFYLFARYFGAGVIIATAFVHLMDPAYGEIGSLSCVGGWGNWSIYSWVPALILASVFGIFLVDIASEVYVERKFGYTGIEEPDIQQMITSKDKKNENEFPNVDWDLSEHQLTSDDQQSDLDLNKTESAVEKAESINSASSIYEFKQQFAAFLILEFGIIFHSVIIGLNLGSCSYDDFKTLYIVLVFHQSFEGLGIGARLSAIPWPSDQPEYYKYLLCLAYGLVTPVSIAIGLGVRTTYVAGGFTANIVSGVLDSLSAGILIYTGLVEFLARDFVFNKEIKRDLTQLLFCINCLIWGAGIMSLIGKWA